MRKIDKTLVHKGPRGVVRQLMAGVVELFIQPLMSSFLDCPLYFIFFQRLLDKTIEQDSEIRKMYKGSVMGSVFHNVKGRFIGWLFLCQNWDKIKNPGLLQTAAKYFNGRVQLEEFDAFVSKHRNDLQESQIKRARHEIMSSMHWMQFHRNTVVDFFVHSSPAQ